MIFLFDEIQAAREVAYMLRGEWDGCNGVVISKIDRAAIETAASLVDAKWCWSFEQCKLPTSLQEEVRQRYRYGKRYFGNLNLAGVDLSCQNLTGIHLAGANMTGANLTGTDLRGASLMDANLSKCKLVSARLGRANLNNATLAGADLSKANLTGAHLSGANLEGAILIGAMMPSGNIYGEQSTVFTDLRVKYAIILSVVLMGMGFWTAQLKEHQPSSHDEVTELKIKMALEMQREYLEQHSTRH